MIIPSAVHTKQPRSTKHHGGKGGWDFSQTKNNNDHNKNNSNNDKNVINNHDNLWLLDDNGIFIFGYVGAFP